MNYNICMRSQANIGCMISIWMSTTRDYDGVNDDDHDDDDDHDHGDDGNNGDNNDHYHSPPSKVQTKTITFDGNSCPLFILTRV